MHTLYIVIPVFDGWESTKICLDKLASSTFNEFCVVLVDHSENGDGQDLATEYLQTLNLVRLKGSPDLWWTGATNIGIRWALKNDADYIMLLNHDCYVDRDAISNLLEHISSNSNSIIAPIQTDSGGNAITRTAYTFYLLGFPTVIPRANSILGSSNRLISTGMIVGGRGAVIPANVFSQVGFLDEVNLPHYGSDNDFYLRCKKEGYKLYIAVDSLVVIDQQQTTDANNIANLDARKFISTFSNRRSHRNIKDQMALFKKHYPIPKMYPIGVFLNLARYLIIYLATRSIVKLKTLFATH